MGELPTSKPVYPDDGYLCKMDTVGGGAGPVPNKLFGFPMVGSGTGASGYAFASLLKLGTGAGSYDSSQFPFSSDTLYAGPT